MLVHLNEDSDGSEILPLDASVEETVLLAELHFLLDDYCCVVEIAIVPCHLRLASKDPLHSHSFVNYHRSG